MKRVSLLFVALGFFAAGCGSSSTAPTPPTNPTFTAALSPANEVPAIAGAEASGSGTATVTMVTTKDSAGNVTAATATFVVNMSGFPAGTSIVNAHIHQAAAGVNGNVVVPSGIAAGANVLANGSGSFTAANLTVDPALANSILANPAGFYFNIHSSLNAGGVARGQLVRTQ
jgi:CHRD domain